MFEADKDRFAATDQSRFEASGKSTRDAGRFLNGARIGVAMRAVGALCIAASASAGFWLDTPHVCKDSKGVYNLDGHFSPDLGNDDRAYFDPEALTAKISDPDCIFGEQDLSRHCNVARLECARQEDKVSTLVKSFGPAALMVIGLLAIRAGRKYDDGDEEEDDEDDSDDFELADYAGEEVTILSNEGTRGLGIDGKRAVVTEIDEGTNTLTIYCLGTSVEDAGPYELDPEDVKLDEEEDDEASKA